MATKQVTSGALMVMVAVMVAAPAMVWAQGAPAPPASGSPAQPPAATTPAAEPYTYSQDDRRDPFVSLVSKGIEPAAGTGKRADGLGSLTIAEMVVRGVLISRGVYIALVSGPDGKTYTARTNDRLADGTIRSITPQGLVIMQEVNDPLSLIKQREVRKGLRSSEDAKQ